MKATAQQRYILVDYENVQSVDLALIEGLAVKVVFFVGQKQKSVPIDLFKKACESNGCVEVIPSVGTSKNAVDFQMACYAGRLAEREPGALIHFVSRDKGFDIVVQYLKVEKRLAVRTDSFSAPALPASKADYRNFTATQRIDYVLGRLERFPATARPKKLGSLQSSIHAMFGKQLDESLVEEVVAQLVSSKRVILGERNAISYNL